MAREKVVGVSLDKETVAKLTEMARRNGITVSMQARMLLVTALKNGKEVRSNEMAGTHVEA